MKTNFVIFMAMCPYLVQDTHCRKTLLYQCPVFWEGAGNLILWQDAVALCEREALSHGDTCAFLGVGNILHPRFQLFGGVNFTINDVQDHFFGVNSFEVV